VLKNHRQGVFALSIRVSSAFKVLWAVQFFNVPISSYLSKVGCFIPKETSAVKWYIVTLSGACACVISNKSLNNKI
jgi:hypothetical protein